MACHAAKWHFALHVWCMVRTQNKYYHADLDSISGFFGHNLPYFDKFLMNFTNVAYVLSLLDRSDSFHYFCSSNAVMYVSLEVWIN